MKNFDFISLSPTLRVQKMKILQNSLGGLLSIFVFCGLVLFTWFLGNSIILKNKPSLVIQNYLLPKSRNVQMLQNNSFFGIHVQDGDGNKDPLMLASINIYATLFTTKFNDGSGGSSNYISDEVPVAQDVNCMNAVNIDNFFTPDLLTSLKCIKDSNFTLAGDYSEKEQSILILHVDICQNSTDTPDIVCPPPDVMKKAIGSSNYVELYFLDYYIDPLNFTNPIQPKYNIVYINLNFELYKEMEIFFMNIEAHSDIGLVTETFVEKASFQFDKNTLDISIRQDNTLATFWLYSNRKDIRYNRRYLKVQELAASLGGIFKLLQVGGLIIIILVNNMQMNLEIINELYDFDNKIFADKGIVNFKGLKIRKSEHGGKLSLERRHYSLKDSNIINNIIKVNNPSPETYDPENGRTSRNNQLNQDRLDRSERQRIKSVVNVNSSSTNRDPNYMDYYDKHDLRNNRKSTNITNITNNTRKQEKFSEFDEQEIPRRNNRSLDKSSRRVSDEKFSHKNNMKNKKPINQTETSLSQQQASVSSDAHQHNYPNDFIIKYLKEEFKIGDNKTKETRYKPPSKKSKSSIKTVKRSSNPKKTVIISQIKQNVSNNNRRRSSLDNDSNLTDLSNNNIQRVFDFDNNTYLKRNKESQDLKAYNTTSLYKNTSSKYNNKENQTKLNKYINSSKTVKMDIIQSESSDNDNYSNQQILKERKNIMREVQKKKMQKSMMDERQVYSSHSKTENIRNDKNRNKPSIDYFENDSINFDSKLEDNPSKFKSELKSSLNSFQTSKFSLQDLKLINSTKIAKLEFTIPEVFGNYFLCNCCKPNLLITKGILYETFRKEAEKYYDITSIVKTSTQLQHFKYLMLTDQQYLATELFRKPYISDNAKILVNEFDELMLINKLMSENDRMDEIAEYYRNQDKELSDVDIKIIQGISNLLNCGIKA